MRDSRETVFPVPDGISRTQWPCCGERRQYGSGGTCSRRRVNAHMGIEAAFEVANVAVLLRVHLVVRKDKLHIVEQELHGGQLVLATGFRVEAKRLGFGSKVVNEDEDVWSQPAWNERSWIDKNRVSLNAI